MIHYKLTNYMFVAILLLACTFLNSCWNGKRSSRELKWRLVRSLELILEQENSYKSQFSGYETLSQLHDAGFIDSAFAAGQKYEYFWEVIVSDDGSKFSCYAWPIERKDLKSYVITEKGLIFGDNINGEKASTKNKLVDTDKYFKP